MLRYARGGERSEKSSHGDAHRALARLLGRPREFAPRDRGPTPPCSPPNLASLSRPEPKRFNADDLNLATARSANPAVGEAGQGPLSTGRKIASLTFEPPTPPAQRKVVRSARLS